MTSKGADHETSCINSELNVYLKINVAQNGAAGLVVTDNAGVQHNVSTDEQGGKCNVFTRDNKDIQGPTPSRYPKYVGSTSYAVVHELVDTSNPNDKGFLYFMDADDCMENGQFKSQPFKTWDDANQAARFVKKYRIRK